MIVTQLLGGLGNQLFQYAMGRALALRHGVELRLDTSHFGDYRLRNYVLGRFDIHAAELSVDERVALGLAAKHSTRFGTMIRRLIGRPSMPVVRERGFEFDPSAANAAAHCYLQGYWQSPKYFKFVDSVIRKDLRVSTDLCGRNADLAEQIGARLAVSVHVRRGDYAANPQTNQYHGTCPPDYYRTAEELLRSRVGAFQLFLFSDDPAWARANLRFSSPVVVVDHNGPEDGHEDLRLMTMCRHHIIANSTFSWWGAWLCGHAEKIVVAPRNWFREARHSTADLIPEDWIRA